jgi:hypothetical protein
MGRVLTALVIALGSVVSWGAEPPVPTPDQGLKTAQGRWRFDPQSGTQWNFDDPGRRLPPPLQSMAADGVVLAVEGNRLTVGNESATIANDLDFLAARQEQVGQSVRGQRLVLLTLPDGKAVLASWNLDEQSLGIRYPAGCCSRSGNILVFRRVME